MYDKNDRNDFNFEDSQSSYQMDYLPFDDDDIIHVQEPQPYTKPRLSEEIQHI